MKDDGARGAEITVEDGELPYCPDCQTKHSADLLAHIDPEDHEKHEKAEWIFKRNLEEVGMTKMQGEDYQKIRELEHKFEDGLTVLRDLRHKIQATPGIDNPVHNSNSSTAEQRKLSSCINKVEHKCCEQHKAILYHDGQADYSKCTCNPPEVCRASVKS